MRKQLLFASVLIGFGAFAQQSIPNGSFETWNVTSFEGPQYYPGNSNNEALRNGLPFNCIKTTDAYHGSYALKITTVANSIDTMFGYFINSNPQDDPTTWHGGMPYNQKATGLRCYYKCDVASGDTAIVFAAFSKAGVNIGTYGFQVYGTKSSYTLLDVNFSPALTQVPDSMIFGATSGNAFANKIKAGSMLQLDSISLTGVTSQPAQLNGDFESWVTTAIEKPASWYIETNRDDSSVKSTSSYKGSYAIELKSFIDQQRDSNNGPTRETARGARASTGYYPKNCNGNCQQQGGFPFTNQSDTLVFWYKYTPVGNAMGFVNSNTKKLGQSVGGNYMELAASSSYQYKEVIINSMTTPDTLIVDFSAQRWEDSLLTQVGSILIVDEVQLKSQPLHTGLAILEKDIKTSVYPNPSKGLIQVDANINISSIEVMNILGEKVFTQSIQAKHTQIDLTQFSKGTYFYRINCENNAVKIGKLFIE